MNTLREHWDTLAFLAIFAIGTLLIALTPLEPIQAASDDPTLCDPWKMAGGVMIYRCEDEEYDVVCYGNGFGMLACMEAW